MADKTSVGLSIDPDLLDRAIAGVPREVNRSERLCQLIRLGLAAEEALEKHDLPVDMHHVELVSTFDRALDAAEFD